MAQYTTDTLVRVAGRIAEMLIEDTKAGTVPVDAESFSEFHGFVDANDYGLHAIADEDPASLGEDPYRLMNDAETVAFAVFKSTVELDELRALCKNGARVHIKGSDTVWVVSSDRVRRAYNVLFVSAFVEGHEDCEDMDGTIGVTELVPVTIEALPAY